MSEGIEVERLRGNFGHLARALPIPIAVIASIIAASAALTPALFAIMPVAILISVFVTLARLTRPRDVIDRGTLRIRQDAIFLGDSALVPRADVKDGIVVPHTREGTMVRLAARAGSPILLRGSQQRRGLPAPV